MPKWWETKPTTRRRLAVSVRTTRKCGPVNRCRFYLWANTDLCRTSDGLVVLLVLRRSEGRVADKADEEQLFVSLVRFFSSQTIGRLNMRTSVSLACDVSMILSPSSSTPPPLPPFPPPPSPPHSSSPPPPLWTV